MTLLNEIDPNAGEWLKNQFPQSTIDTRSIHELMPDDLIPFNRVHLFAGIGGWEHALRLAGWPDDRPVWTGSCPCQPFSCAGKGKGAEDERHLWPEMFRLIRQCRPDAVVGEQVEAAIGLGWLDGVFADLESEGYACGAIVLGAHSVGAPHIRQRIYWLAYSGSATRERRTGGFSDAQAGVDCQGQLDGSLHQRSANGSEVDGLAIATGIDGSEHDRAAQKRRRAEDSEQVGVGSGTDGLAYAEHSQSRSGVEGGQGQERIRRDRPAIDSADGGPRTGPAWIPCPCECREFYCTIHEQHAFECPCPPIDEWDVDPYTTGGLGLPQQQGLEGHAGNGDGGRQPGRLSAPAVGPTATTSGPGFWTNYDIIPCRDGKSRRAESGSFPLAHGIPRDRGSLIARLGELGCDPKAARRIISDASRNRVGRLKGYGNAICVPLAAEFIRTVIDCLPQ